MSGMTTVFQDLTDEEKDLLKQQAESQQEADPPEDAPAEGAADVEGADQDQPEASQDEPSGDREDAADADPKDDEGGQPKATDDKPADAKADSADSSDDGADDFEAFRAKHKDKSPEDLVKHLYQQNKARSAERAQRRAAEEKHATWQERLRGIAQAHKQQLEQAEADAKREEEELLELQKTDPDKAAARIAKIASEGGGAAAVPQRVREQAYQQLIEEQTRICHEVIPDFEKTQTEIVRFGVESMRYSPEEIANVNDYRDILTLNLARLGHMAIQSGLIDYQTGQPTQPGAPASAPQAAPEAPSAGAEQLQRIASKTKAPGTLTNASRSQTGKGETTAEQKAKAFLEEDLFKSLETFSAEDFNELQAQLSR